jgi:hypothetical protein
VPSPLGSELTTVTVALFPQRPVGGPILFDAQLREGRVEGRILGSDPEYAAADEGTVMHVWRWTKAGPVPPRSEPSLPPRRSCS